MIVVLKASTTSKRCCRPIKFVVYIYELKFLGAIFIFSYDFMLHAIHFDTLE